MTGILYKLVGEKNRLDKTSYLTSPIEFNNLVIKHPSSMTDPVITISSAGDMWNYNYIYLEGFYRYYFIEDIVSIANNLWELHCHVDVLMTWKLEIKQNKAIVLRSSNKGNPYLEDRINSALPQYTVKKYSNFNLFNLTTTSYVGHNSPMNVLLFVRNDAISVQSSQVTDRGPGLQRPATGCSVPFFGGMIYIVDAIMLNTIIANYGSDANKMSSIIKAVAFPFNVYELIKYFASGQIQETKGIKLVDMETAEHVTMFDDDTIYYIPYFSNLMASITLEDYISDIEFNNNYLDYQPYTHYYIHLPMFGDVELSADDLNRSYLGLDVVFDIWNGTMTYSLFVRENYSSAYGNEKNILTQQAIIGSQLVIAFDNADLAIKQYNETVGGNWINVIAGLGTVLAALAIPGIGGAVAAGMAVGGASTAISSAASGTVRMLNTRSSEAGSSGQNSGTYNTYIDCGIYFYKKSYEPLYQYDDNDYVDVIGRPANTVVQIGDCSGYLEVGTCHLDGINALSKELDEITTLLQSGILI